ncbi:MAG: hypothetical protein FJ276_18500 [Planctomycetes bacterium]|nr:hypothetical protein [Planctomycetota bacterium]
MVHLTDNDSKLGGGMAKRGGLERVAVEPGRGVPASGVLWLWMALVCLSHGVLWATGTRQFLLAEAVEEGAAQVERRTRGEESEDVIRKEIRLQRDTLVFWRVIAAISDFVVAPLALAMRALIVAVAFSAVAATFGRPVRFAHGLAESMVYQGIWVAGIVLSSVLILVLQVTRVETSVLAFMPPGSYSGPLWVALRQVDGFAAIGWFCLAWSAWRRGQSNLAVALAVCVMLALLEAAVFASASLLVNLSMRLTLVPA